MISVALPSQVKKPPGALTFWIIYDHPPDYPYGFVLRPQFVMAQRVEHSMTAWYASDADMLRAILPEGAVYMGRQNGDDPNILEAWME